MRLPADLIRFDSMAGLTAGALMLLAAPWLSELYAVPSDYLLVNAAANLGYGSFSGWLSRHAVRSLMLITVLVIANAVWAVLCAGALVWLWPRASGFGLAHLVGEALFVGGLAVLEWERRHQLTRAAVR